mgnify:CR=1 FL=1
MPDWELTEQRIYQLLKHPYQIDKSVVENMTSAYLEFVEELFAYIANTKDNKEIIRKLNINLYRICHHKSIWRVYTYRKQ